MNLTEQILVKEELESLQHTLKVHFGLPPSRPTKTEVIQIVEKMKNIPDNKRTDKKWMEVINEIVPHIGMYKYEGLDYSEANNLLDQIITIIQD